MSRKLEKTLKASLLFVTIFLSACCTAPSNPVLKLPPPLVTPVLKMAELECVSDETFKKIDLLSNLKSERIKTLENIIKSTHKTSQQSEP